MKTLIALAVLVLFGHPITLGQRIELLFVKEDKVNYNGYTITRSFKRDGQTPLIDALTVRSHGGSLTIVSRNQEKLATIEGCCYEESTRFALIPLLGNGRKQLVVEAYSGGGHCCTSYHIYDLSTRFRTIFDGDKYTEQVGYEMDLVDIDKDGGSEFVQRVMNFDYFYVSHAGSVFPEVVFAYDRRAGVFRPANRAFASYLLRDIRKKEHTVSNLNEDAVSLSRIRKGRGSEKTPNDMDFRERYYHAVADVLLTYVFAGKEKEGWRYFDKNYKLCDKEHLRTGLRKTLAGSTVYKSIYHR